MERKVVAYRDETLRYPCSAPFDPECVFPEYPFGEESVQSQNRVYGAVREVLRRAGLDASHYNTPRWNPLADLVDAGGTVMIKPNWVRHYHLHGEDIYSLITHPAVLRPLVDFAFKAVGAEGRIWVMDAPQFDSDFEAIKELGQLDTLEETLRRRGVPLTIADLRSLTVDVDCGVVYRRRRRASWECEGIEFDLGADSEFCELEASLKNIFGSDYDRRVTCRYHNARDGVVRHRYKISRRVLEADLVISVPKLKTHKKTGVTLNIKNMIGINTDKNYIPHYRVGAPSQGGDEFPETDRVTKVVKRWLVRHAVDVLLGRLGRAGERGAHAFMCALLAVNKKRLEAKAGGRLDPIDVFYRGMQGDDLRTGNWWGNDTCWRGAVDINKILLHGSADGRMMERQVRRYFSLIDGIVAGDEDGPMAATPRQEGVLIAGFDPVSTDTVATSIMGFRSSDIRDLARGAQLRKYPLTEQSAVIVVDSNRAEWHGAISAGSDLGFRPHFAWRSYLGRER